MCCCISIEAKLLLRSIFVAGTFVHKQKSDLFSVGLHSEVKSPLFRTQAPLLCPQVDLFREGGHHFNNKKKPLPRAERIGRGRGISVGVFSSVKGFSLSCLLMNTCVRNCIRVSKCARVEVRPKRGGSHARWKTFLCEPSQVKAVAQRTLFGLPQLLLFPMIIALLCSKAQNSARKRFDPTDESRSSNPLQL